MIVQCDKCRTKFRIADAKVTDRGVKVRCSRCAHVFVVRREDAAEPEFSERGPDTARVDPAAMLSLAAASTRTQTDPHGDFTTAQTEVGLGGAPRPPPSPSRANTEQAAIALGFTTEPAPSQSLGDSFADLTFGQENPDGPGIPAPFTEPSHAPFGTPSKSLPPQGLESFDHEGPTVAGPTSEAPPPPADDGLAGPAPGPGPDGGTPDGGTPSLPSFPSWSEDESDTFPPPEAETTGDELRFPPPADSEPTANYPKGYQPPPSAAPSGDLPDASLGDIPGLLPQGHGDDNPFENLDNEPSAQNGGAYSQFGGSVDEVDFSALDSPPEPADPPSGDALAKIELAKAAGVPDLSDGFGQHETTAIAPAYNSGGAQERPRVLRARSELPTVGDRAGPWPTIAGAIVGVGVVLFAFPDVGRSVVDAVSRRGADALTQVALTSSRLPEGLTTVRALDTHVRPYPNAKGESLLVVKGRARNLGDTPVADLEAVALVLDGEQVVARRSAPVGVVLDPETLAGIDAPEDLEGAYAAAVPDGDLEPGAERPFMVVFARLPENASGRVYRVEFTKTAATARTDDPSPEASE